MDRKSEPTLEGPLFERIRRALSHDLRTPIGTISNYATILEYHGPEKTEDVRVFARRIRDAATRTVAMLQSITEAIALARQASSAAGMDPAGSLRALVVELGIHVRFPARGPEPTERIPLDAELVTFAWRAFLSMTLDAARTGALDVDLAIENGESSIALDMFTGERDDAPREHVDSERLARAEQDVPPEALLALGLAEDLVHMRGGEISLWGRPGLPWGMRIRLPKG
jgi:signal transduction histidine kinase